ncbi:MAG: helix-turn-helix transcriptional regulator [Lachnospiraceae bacterium]|nr:helix-turn-helix transcriptional regulator [Lachnospiraceae bacterium]
MGSEKITDDSLKKILSQNIKAYLKANKMSQRAAAEKAGIKLSTFNSWVRTTSFPDDQNLLRLAAVFGVTPSELIRERSGGDRPGFEYMKVGEIELLKRYRDDPAFQAFISDLVIVRSNELLETYIEKLKELK